jgi:hypothetical protein
VVDTAYFREENPNYTRPSIKESDKGPPSYIIDLAKITEKLSPPAKKSKSNGMDLSEIKGDDLLICSPTVLRFSLSNKR